MNHTFIQPTPQPDPHIAEPAQISWPPFTLASYEAQAAGDPTYIPHILTIILRTLQRTITQVQAAQQLGDQAAIAAQVHALKPTLQQLQAHPQLLQAILHLEKPHLDHDPTPHIQTFLHHTTHLHQKLSHYHQTLASN